MSCEDFPCCGHELGCCPDYSDDGSQINMRCTCGAVLPIDNRYSICDGCMRDANDEVYAMYDEVDDEAYDDEEEYHQQEDFGDWGEAGLWE